jgi:hypothetical protein
MFCLKYNILVIGGSVECIGCLAYFFSCSDCNIFALS